MRLDDLEQSNNVEDRRGQSGGGGGFGLPIGDLGWGRSPTSGPTAPAPAATSGRAARTATLPCPSAPGSLRLVPCAAVPSAFVRPGGRGW